MREDIEKLLAQLHFKGMTQVLEPILAQADAEALPVVRRALQATGLMLSETTDSFLTSSQITALSLTRSPLTSSWLTSHLLRMIFIFFPHALTRERGGLERGWALRSGGRVVERR